MSEAAEAAHAKFQTLIGQESEPGEWIQVTQEMINQFADVTMDHQFIHVDPEAAKNTPFGGTIAHGFLTLS
ncbi:MAG TPA: dehydratase, partial [Acidimicrobiaceae bacterium]|nr:dehydratase [Acidimicrobiaceae bacterium]